MSQFVDRFGSIGSEYAQFRPRYPPVVFDTVLDFASKGGRDLAVDIGCGSGQATLPLTHYFAKVIGFEPSEGQLKNVEVRAVNLEFKQAPAEKIPLPDCSVDLIITAQAAHWFDLDAFFSESDRILKPEGCLAIWGYGNAQLSDCEDDAEAKRLFDDFYENTLGDKYWAPNRKLIDTSYKTIIPPSSKFDPIIRRNELAIEQETNLDGFVGYLSSWSGLAKYRQVNPDKPDPLEELKPKLAKCIGKKPFKVTWPIFMILARKCLRV